MPGTWISSAASCTIEPAFLFQVWAATVGDQLAAGAAEVLVNAHADTSDEDFRAAYLGQRTSVRNKAECGSALVR